MSTANSSISGGRVVNRFGTVEGVRSRREEEGGYQGGVTVLEMNRGTRREVSVKEFKRANKRRPEVPGIEILDILDATKTTLERAKSAAVVVKVGPNDLQAGADTEGVLQIARVASVIANNT